MKSRGMVGIVAFLLASVATMTLFLYVHGVKKKAETGGAMVSVVVSKQDIPAGTNMDTLISQGSFTTESVPKTTQIDGAITSLEQLRGKVSSVPILAGEQIPAARLQGSTELPGGTLGIPAGMEATTVQLDAQRILGGQIHAGDHVEIFGSFSPPVSAHVTLTLVPDVKVVRVSKPSTADQATDQGTFITMALRTQDAEKVIFAQEHGFVWMALVPPGQNGERKPPMTFGGLLK